jgi:hypothetical protein
MQQIICVQPMQLPQDAVEVLVKRRGRERWNYLNAIPIREIHDRWIGVYAAEAAGLLARLNLELSHDHT